jgi:hypothetical protein
MDFDTADTMEANEPVSTDSSSSSVAEGTADDPSFDDFDNFANHKVTVKVGGAEERVPLAELRNGYMRQADYTRKTQELSQARKDAEWAAAMRSAFASDPQGTLTALAEHLGVSLGNPQVNDVYDDDPRIQTLEQKIAAFERQQAQAKLERELDSLASRFDDFDRDAVVRFAVANRLDNLELAYKSMTWEAKAEAAARADAERKRAETEAGIVDKKRQAAVVNGGRGANASAEPVGNSTRDVLMATARELGIKLPF